MDADKRSATVAGQNGREGAGNPQGAEVVGLDDVPHVGEVCANQFMPAVGAGIVYHNRDVVGRSRQCRNGIRDGNVKSDVDNSEVVT